MSQLTRSERMWKHKIMQFKTREFMRFIEEGEWIVCCFKDTTYDVWARHYVDTTYRGLYLQMKAGGDVK